MAGPPDPTWAAPGWTNQNGTGDVEAGAGPTSASATLIPAGALGATTVAGTAFPAAAVVNIVGGTVTDVKVNSTDLVTQTTNIPVPAGGKLTVAYTGTPSVVLSQFEGFQGLPGVQTPNANGILSLSGGH